MTTAEPSRAGLLCNNCDDEVYYCTEHERWEHYSTNYPVCHHTVNPPPRGWHT